MLVSFDNRGEPFVAQDGLRLIPAINDVMKRNITNGKAMLLYIACMVDYESPFLVRFPDPKDRQEAVLKAYANRKIGNGHMTKSDVESNWVKEAMHAYFQYQKNSTWEFYYALEKKIDECDMVLNKEAVNMANVDEQKKIMQLRKEAYLTYKDVHKEIITKVTTSTTSTGKAKAHQLKDIRFIDK